MIYQARQRFRLITLIAASTVAAAIFLHLKVSAATQTSNGSVGLQGTISAPPPTQGATIAVPTNGQTFSQLPITVTGICPTDLLVKLFKNNVFSGSTPCTNGSYSITTDLFAGANELVVRVFDALDQAGPDSNVVTVNFNDGRGDAANRVSLTSNFAKKGAEPGTILYWTLIISGGVGPYAVSVDWGDKEPADLLSQPSAGEFTVNHTYKSSGIYTIIVRVTDSLGSTAFLQLVGIATGPISQEVKSSATTRTTTKTTVIWWPAALLIPLSLIAFWLGKRHQIQVIRKKIIKGEHPF